jgi:adenosylcobinamide-GDP ribazoletransferase
VRLYVHLQEKNKPKIILKWKKNYIYFYGFNVYTRIPCPATIDHNPDYLNKASRYFPLVGWIVGSAAFVVLCFLIF